MKNGLLRTMIMLILFVFVLPLQAQVNLDTVRSQKFDTGKMWTFEDYPQNYIKSTYGFNASQDWLIKVRLSALRFSMGCSASFVSEDGLIMTNHHCVDGMLESVQREGENIPKNGFFAANLAEERKIPRLSVDQLVYIEDVTAPVLEAMNSGNTDAEKNEKKDAKIKELKTSYEKNSGLVCNIIQLYNGRKYSLYSYKRYNDIRLVYSNERVVGLYGGDPDNFTYPRYDADFAFLRAYDESGKPMKTENFFKFSPNGATENELLFVVGNPGSTQRLKTVAQLEYFRDVTYKNSVFVSNRLFSIYDELIAEEPAKADEYRGQQFSIGNSAKVFKGVLAGLQDPVFMARKKDFEQKLKNAVMANPELKEKYSHIWDGIVQTRNEARKFAFESAAYSIRIMTPTYLSLARKLVTLANDLKKPEADRAAENKAAKLDSTINALFPSQHNISMYKKLTAMIADLMIMNVGKDNALVKKMFNGLSGNAAADYALKNSSLTSKEKFVELAKKDPDTILNSSDPFIYYVVYTQDKVREYFNKTREISITERALESQLGQVLFAVYGTSIPPEATFTLRISDGVMKSYEYNGTIAPTITTFYGMYDRYYSHKKQYPWDLPARWTKPAPEFNYSSPYNFISTNDIIGGNSGSAIINTKAEVVGAVFDGNMESLAGNFIYTTEANRTVSVASQGILEILKNITNAKRIAEELKVGKIPNQFSK